MDKVEATSTPLVEAQAAPKKKPRSKEGLAEAKAAATMTSKEWQQCQIGMAEKWPAPEYMKTPQPGRSHTAYRDETYAVVTRWTEETRISYRPHAKAPGTKSHVRYEQYSRARTVGEALKLGTLPGDWCWDYERGFIRVHGPVRDEPIDMSRVTDESMLTKVDMIIVRWYRRELAKNLGLKYEDLAVGKGSGESTLMRAHRLVAQREAKKRLEAAAAEGRRVTDEEVELTLKEWAFARNPYRVNVMKEGQTWVWSDTLGLLIDRIGDIHITTATTVYPAVTRILVQWLRERLPPEASKFGFTSLNLNCNYAAQLHRDKNNFGPSLIKAFGSFTGGELNYWPEDDKSTKPEELPQDQKVQRQLRDGLMMFNGNCAHSVEDFQGQRFSVVYFTLGCFAKAKPEDRSKLEELGLILPPVDAERGSLLRAPRGYGPQQQSLAAQAEAEPQPELRYWPTSELEAQPIELKPLPPLPEPGAAHLSRPKLEPGAGAAEEEPAKAATPQKKASRQEPVVRAGNIQQQLLRMADVSGTGKRTAQGEAPEASPVKAPRPTPPVVSREVLEAMQCVQVE